MPWDAAPVLLNSPPLLFASLPCHRRSFLRLAWALHLVAAAIHDTTLPFAHRIHSLPLRHGASQCEAVTVLRQATTLLIVTPPLHCSSLPCSCYSIPRDTCARPFMAIPLQFIPRLFWSSPLPRSFLRPRSSFPYRCFSHSILCLTVALTMPQKSSK